MEYLALGQALHAFAMWPFAGTSPVTMGRRSKRYAIKNESSQRAEPPDQQSAIKTVLLASAVNSPVASRMAIRFAHAGCRVAAAFPSGAHLLSTTQAVAEQHRYSIANPLDSLFSAIRSSKASIVIPCDTLAARQLHALHGGLPAGGEQVSRTIERSLGDPTAFLVLDSRHEVQVAARMEGLDAAESYALGRATDPSALAQSLEFPWILKTDYAWGGLGARVVENLDEAREFIRRAGAPPGLGKALVRLTVHGDRSAMGDWLHDSGPGLSVQRPVPGQPASIVAACWQGEVLALLAVEGLPPCEPSWPPAKVRIVEGGRMEETVRRMARRLGLSGFHEFRFVLESGTSRPWLTEINAHCAAPAHLNGGPGRDPVDAICRQMLGVSPPEPWPVHRESLVALFPQAWIANPDDPDLKTAAYDIPKEDPKLVARALQLASRGRQYRSLRDRLRALGKGGGPR